MDKVKEIIVSIALVFIIAFILAFVSFRVFAWDHAVIMKPHEGATYTVPLVPGMPNCVYVTDCKSAIYTPEEPGTPAELPVTEPPTPPVVSELPTPRGAYGWSFGNLIEDRSAWVATADDAEPNGGTNYKAMAAIDDPASSSIWHSTWSADTDPPLPHWIAIDMGQKHWVDGMIMTPRMYEADKPWYINGVPIEYEVWVAENGCDAPWGRVANGTLDYGDPPMNGPQTIDFLIPNLVQCVKFVVTKALGTTPENAANFASVRDIQITESLKDIEITGGAVQ